MSSLSDFAVLWEGFERSFESGRVAHAYLIVGSPRGAGLVFAQAMIRKVLGVSDEALHRIEARMHPDLMWIEPQSKSRMILVDELRDLNKRMSQTAMESGWKVGVIAFADRMNEQASNAFLKTLEEPSGQTLLLLISDAPHQLLPTILSRCQQIHLNAGAEPLDPEWVELLVPLLREQQTRDLMHALVLAENMRGVLDLVKKKLEKEGEPALEDEDVDENRMAARVQARLLETRQQVLALLMHWYRDLLMTIHGLEPEMMYFPEETEALQRQAAGMKPAAALRRIEAVEEVARRLSRNMSPSIVLDAGAIAPFLRR